MGADKPTAIATVVEAIKQYPNDLDGVIRFITEKIKPGNISEYKDRMKKP